MARLLPHGRTLLRLAVLCALVVAALLGSDAAEACSFADRRMSRIVGFEPDGRFVEHFRHVNDGDEDLHEEWFKLFDPNGKELSSLTLSDQEGPEREGRGDYWKSTGAPYFGRLARGLGDGDAGRLEKAIVKAKKLTMPVKRRALRHVKSEAECGSVELETGDGWLRVAEAHSLRGTWGDECSSFTLDGFEHPKVSLLFVRVRQHIGSGDRLRDTDVVARLSRRRVEGVTLAWRGERARLKGQLDEAITALEASIDAAPEYLPSRISLVRAYAAAGREPAPLLAALRRPIPEARHYVGGRPDDELIAKLLGKWPAAKLPEALPWSDPRWGWRQHSETFD
jgi:hypothetical protein